MSLCGIFQKIEKLILSYIISCGFSAIEVLSGGQRRGQEMLSLFWKDYFKKISIKVHLNFFSFSYLLVKWNPVYAKMFFFKLKNCRCRSPNFRSSSVRSGNLHCPATPYLSSACQCRSPACWYRSLSVGASAGRSLSVSLLTGQNRKKYFKYFLPLEWNGTMKFVKFT